MDNTFFILGEKIKAGSSQVLSLNIAKLPTGTSIEIPIYVFNAKEKGETILLQAGLHGDEINGVESLKRILNSKKLKNLKKGRVIVVPLLNVYGFLNYSRDVTDGKDANRSFPGTKKGSLASRIAYHYTKEVLSLVDYGIDLHTGGGQRSNYPQTRYAIDLPKNKVLSDWFSAPISFESKLISKSIRKTASNKNIPFIVYEAGESNRLDEKSIQIGIDGIYRVLYQLEMLDFNPLPKEKSIKLQHRKWIRAKNAGIFISHIENGTRVVKNQIIGEITDVHSSESVKIKAEKNAYVFCVNHQAVVFQGDALYHIGLIV